MNPQLIAKMLDGLYKSKIDQLMLLKAGNYLRKKSNQQRFFLLN